MDYKHCPRCGEDKSVDNFYRNKGTKTGFASYCKHCWRSYYRDRPNSEKAKARKREYMARYREENPEAWAKWYRSNPERRLDYCKRDRTNSPNRYKGYYLKKFGITLEDFQGMLDRQGGLCAICQIPQKTQKSLAVDHCHETGRVRGLLCESCNRGLGLLRDSVEVLSRAANYIVITKR